MFFKYQLLFEPPAQKMTEKMYILIYHTHCMFSEINFIIYHRILSTEAESGLVSVAILPNRKRNRK